MSADLIKISKGEQQWKISFNHNGCKHPQQVVFSRKKSKSNHPAALFNNVPTKTEPFQKGFLDKNLTFLEHNDGKVNKKYQSITQFEPVITPFFLVNKL